MFPAADARGRVLGFGARAMRENQPPKYLNTSDGELYHKRSQLFGIDLARARRRSRRPDDPRRGLHRRARAPSGRDAQRGRDHGHLADRGAGRRARADRRSVLELCLDADRAGQEAMLRAARLAERRQPPLELRVVPLPEGTDPAELIEREGAEALRALRRGLGAVRRLPRRADPRPGRLRQRRGARPRARRARPSARRAAGRPRARRADAARVRTARAVRGAAGARS